MPPIVLVTRNRHAVLDITLRSLSASGLSDDQELIICDDGSDNQVTQTYLYSDKSVHLSLQWPNNKHWSTMGLDAIESRHKGRGLDGRVTVMRMSKKSRGVVNASCRAFVLAVEKYGPERGIIIVQDDVIFTDGWMQKMQAAVEQPEPAGRPVGLVAGCWINKKNAHKRSPMTLVPNGGITAQCYYVTPKGIEVILPWTKRKHSITRGFDNKFCAYLRDKTDLYRMHPAVCQHIGMESLVRPGWRWTRWHAKGRIDFSTRGPFVLGDDVRAFNC